MRGGEAWRIVVVMGSFARLAVVLALAGAPACVRPNPAFAAGEGTSGGETTGPDAPGSSSSGSIVVTTSSSVDVTGTGSATAGPTEVAGSTTEQSVDVSSDGSSDTSSGETGASSSTGGPADPVIVPAAIGVCVYLEKPMMAPYGPPPQCPDGFTSLNATAQTGLVGIDTELQSVNGQGRTAVVLLRFDLPEALMDVTVTAVRLELRVADGTAASGGGGSLWTAAEFDAASLAMAPPLMQLEVGAPVDTVAVGELVTWDLPPALADKPAMFLALVPTVSDAAIYHGDASPDAPPRLVIESSP